MKKYHILQAKIIHHPSKILIPYSTFQEIQPHNVSSLTAQLANLPTAVTCSSVAPECTKMGHFYSQSPSPLRISKPAQSQLPGGIFAPHSHPDPPPKWTNPSGYGARHVNDTAPFTLWDKDRQRFRLPTPVERAWLTNFYKPLSWWFCFPRVIITTENPPLPVPLTVACVTAIFTPPEPVPKPLAGSSPCVGPRIPDPCKGIKWPRWERLRWYR